MQVDFVDNQQRNIRTSFPFSYLAAGSANQDAQNIASIPCAIYGYELYNNTSSQRYVKFYNQANPTSLMIPVRRIMLPGISGGSGVARDSMRGIWFSTALAFRITTGEADNDTGTVSAGDVLINVDFA